MAQFFYNCDIQHLLEEEKEEEGNQDTWLTELKLCLKSNVVAIESRPMQADIHGKGISNASFALMTLTAHNSVLNRYRTLRNACHVV